MQSGETYPIVKADFVKETGHANPEIYAETVRLVQIAKFGYQIITGTIYKWNGYDTDVWSQQEMISCEYKATAEWIYENQRAICSACNSGDIITDIPFESE